MSLKRKEIVDYIAKNNLTAQKRFWLYYVIKEAGDGVKPTSSSIVTVAYKGYYTDGEVFDESSQRNYISFTKCQRMD
jgi:FKBP-type peptidyl-prolyl cis-trans isomerase FkpA